MSRDTRVAHSHTITAVRAARSARGAWSVRASCTTVCAFVLPALRISAHSASARRRSTFQSRESFIDGARALDSQRFSRLRGLCVRWLSSPRAPRRVALSYRSLHFRCDAARGGCRVPCPRGTSFASLAQEEITRYPRTSSDRGCSHTPPLSDAKGRVMPRCCVRVRSDGRRESCRWS